MHICNLLSRRQQNYLLVDPRFLTIPRDLYFGRLVAGVVIYSILFLCVWNKAFIEFTNLSARTPCPDGIGRNDGIYLENWLFVDKDLCVPEQPVTVWMDAIVFYRLNDIVVMRVGIELRVQPSNMIFRGTPVKCDTEDFLADFSLIQSKIQECSWRSVATEAQSNRPEQGELGGVTDMHRTYPSRWKDSMP